MVSKMEELKCPNCGEVIASSGYGYEYSDGNTNEKENKEEVREKELNEYLKFKETEFKLKSQESKVQHNKSYYDGMSDAMFVVRKYLEGKDVNCDLDKDPSTDQQQTEEED